MRGHRLTRSVGVAFLALALSGCATEATPTLYLAIATRPSFSPRPGQADVCMDARFGGVRIGRSGDEMTFTSTDTGQRLDLVWPHGFSAVVNGGIGVLLDSAGRVIGHEGDTLRDLGGGSGQVCSIDGRTYSD